MLVGGKRVNDYELKIKREIDKHDKLLSECTCDKAIKIEDIRHRLAIINIQVQEREI